MTLHFLTFSWLYVELNPRSPCSHAGATTLLSLLDRRQIFFLQHFTNTHIWSHRVVVFMPFLVWPCLRKRWWLVKQHNLDSLQRRGKRNHICVANAWFGAMFSPTMRCKQGRSGAWPDGDGTTWRVLSFRRAVKWNARLLACQRQPG